MQLMIREATPQKPGESALGDLVCDKERWEKLFGRSALQRIEDDLVRVAVALGCNEEDARMEWSDFLYGRTCSDWNAEISSCVRDAVDVKKWLFDNSGKACEPATDRANRARLRLWARMGKAVSSTHSGWPILSLIARRVLVVHATACAAERNWSAWKRLCKAERASMTLEHFKQRMMVAEYYNGR